MGANASQITSFTIVYSCVYSGADQRKHKSSASLAFVRGIRRGSVDSPHKWPVTRKMSPFDDVIMFGARQDHGSSSEDHTSSIPCFVQDGPTGLLHKCSGFDSADGDFFLVPHRTRVVLDFLQQGNATKMEQPARSQDCNPIEHIMDELGCAITCLDNPSQNLGEPRQALLDKWAEIPVERLQRLVASIIAARCGNTW